MAERENSVSLQNQGDVKGVSFRFHASHYTFSINSFTDTNADTHTTTIATSIHPSSACLVEIMVHGFSRPDTVSLITVCPVTRQHVGAQCKSSFLRSSPLLSPLSSSLSSLLVASVSNLPPLFFSVLSSFLPTPDLYSCTPRVQWGPMGKRTPGVFLALSLVSLPRLSPSPSPPRLSTSLLLPHLWGTGKPFLHPSTRLCCT